MKKLRTYVSMLIAAMLLLLVGCSSSAPRDSVTADTAAAAAAVSTEAVTEAITEPATEAATKSAQELLLEALPGSWSAYGDISDFVNEALNAELHANTKTEDIADLFADYPFTFGTDLKLALNEDGTYQLENDSEAAANSINQLHSDLSDAFDAVMETAADARAQAEYGCTYEELLQSAGMSFDEAIALTFERYGTTKESFLDSVITESFSTDSFAIREEGTYSVDGTVITLLSTDGSSITLQFQEETGTLSASIDLGEAGTAAVEFSHE